jgi:hypothetical protein
MCIEFPVVPGVSLKKAAIKNAEAYITWLQTTYHPSTLQISSQLKAQGLRDKPIAFVKVGASPPAKSWRKGRNPYQLKQPKTVYSSFRSYISDMGDNYSLCDKDCGWCGHCADYIDF